MIAILAATCAASTVFVPFTRELQTPDVEDAGRESEHEQHYLERDVELVPFIRRHALSAMKCPAEVYTLSDRPYQGLPDLEYPFHDRDVLVTACGRICIYRKKINISTVLARQRLGIKEVDDGIWLVTFIDYDLGYIDLEQRTLQPVDNPFGPRLSCVDGALRSSTFWRGEDCGRGAVMCLASHEGLFVNWL